MLLGGGLWVSRNPIRPLTPLFVLRDGQRTRLQVNVDANLSQIAIRRHAIRKGRAEYFVRSPTKSQVEYQSRVKVLFIGGWMAGRITSKQVDNNLGTRTRTRQNAGRHTPRLDGRPGLLFTSQRSSLHTKTIFSRMPSP
jgi:hypothetical protein